MSKCEGCEKAKAELKAERLAHKESLAQLSSSNRELVAAAKAAENHAKDASAHKERNAKCVQARNEAVACRDEALKEKAKLEGEIAELAADMRKANEAKG